MNQVKERIYQTLDELPEESLIEIVRFIDFLKFKHKAESAKPIIALGGLWKGINFDVTDKDVRALRQRISQELLRRT